MELWKKITIGIVLGLSGTYFLCSLLCFSPRREQPVCQQLLIEIADSAKKQFTTAHEMRQFILRSGLNPEGEPISENICCQLEELALQHPMARQVCVFPTPNGNIMVRVFQREPKLRVLGADNYYIDSDRRVMQVRSTTAADVPIVTGHVSQRMAQEELFDFIEWLEDDDFWMAQIEQIHVVGPRRIELIPRVGSGVILLGSLADYEQKLKKLKILYQDGFSKFGWKEYKEIDLRFRNQVVCR